MHKYLLPAFIITSSFLAGRTNGQSLYYAVAESNQAVAPNTATTTIAGTVLSAKTTQKTPSGINAIVNPLTVGTGVYTSGPFGVVYCWETPSAAAPLNISIPIGCYLLVPAIGYDSLRAAISFASGSGKPVTYYGPTVTAPKTGSVMVPLPACSMTYTAPPPVKPDTLYTANQNPNPGALFTISVIN